MIHATHTALRSIRNYAQSSLTHRYLIRSRGFEGRHLAGVDNVHNDNDRPAQA